MCVYACMIMRMFVICFVYVHLTTFVYRFQSYCLLVNDLITLESGHQILSFLTRLRTCLNVLLYLVN